MRLAAALAILAVALAGAPRGSTAAALVAAMHATHGESNTTLARRGITCERSAASPRAGDAFAAAAFGPYSGVLNSL